MIDGALAGIKADLNLDVRLHIGVRNALLRDDVFERQVADELPQHLHLHLRRLFGRGPVAVLGHVGTLPRRPKLASGVAPCGGRLNAASSRMGRARRGFVRVDLVELAVDDVGPMRLPARGGGRRR